MCKETNLPGGIPGKDMLIKESENLTLLAKVAKKTPEDLLIEIYPALDNAGLICKDVGDVWGYTVAETLPEDKGIIHTMKVMEGLGIKASQANITRFMSLVFILDGDCPECGYYMEVSDGEYKTIGDGWNEEIEYIPIWESLKCPHCGYKEDNEPDYDY